MGGRDTDGTGHPKRQNTDESLRVERDKADASASGKRDAVEDAADEVVRVARHRADELIQTARDEADRGRAAPPSPSESSFARDRTRADGLLEQERADADAVLGSERALRRRYIADFLTVEREATDKDLTNERVHADTVIAARDAFLATVSHDLRSLLGGLSVNADVLAQHAPEGPGGGVLRKHVATTKRLVARMNRLVSDLLDVASIEAGKLGLDVDHVDVGPIIRDTLEAFAPIAAAKRITLDADVAMPPSTARLDDGRILQVLANLVSNAIKFTPAGGRVAIRVTTDGGELHFAVSDTGVGIPDAALPRVFERYHQVSEDRRGLGLGLHISRSIVEAHGGRMWAESKLGAGSTFHFTLSAVVA